MSNDNPGGANGGGGGGGGVRRFPTLSRGERLELADLLVRWSAALDGARDVIDEYARCVEDLRGLGAALDELELDRRVSQGLMIIRQMVLTEDLSKNTRQYLRNLLGAALNLEFPE